jgi:hypothetical protein
MAQAVEYLPRRNKKLKGLHPPPKLHMKYYLLLPSPTP